MKTIETIAPIPLDQLKEYFIDKDVVFLVKYQESTLKDEQLLIYLSNLEIPCDLLFKDVSELYEVLETYLVFDRLVNVPILKHFVINILLETRNLVEPKHSDFIVKNKEVLNVWSQKLDSLTLYNLYTVQSPQLKEFVKSHGESEYDGNAGINFVQLLDEPLFYEFYRKVDKNNLKYFPSYFNNNMFNGKTLYQYWANENNPLFLVNWGILTDGGNDLTEKEYLDDTSIQ